MMPVLPRDPGAVGGGVSGVTATCPGCVSRPASDSMARLMDWLGTDGGASGSIRALALDGASAGVSARAIAGFCFVSSTAGALEVVSSGRLDPTGRDGVDATAVVSALG